MSKVAKATFGLMIATMIAKILGFGRELVLASAYGATMYSDAYITAMSIPTVIFASIGTSLGTVIIPMFMEVDGIHGKKKSLEFINNIFNIVTLLCILISLLCLIFTEEIVKVFALGFNEETFRVTVNFTRVAIIGLAFTGLTYIMTAYLQIKNNFTITGLASLPKNIVIIVSILLSIKYSPYIMIWGTLIGVGVELLFLLPFAIKNGYKYKLILDFKNEYVKKMLVLIVPVFIGVAVSQVNIMVDRTLASTIGEGAVSALNYASKLNIFVTVLFITSIGAVIYPMLSKLSTNNNKEKFTEYVIRSINSVVLLVMPISVGAIILANPIIKILFERGAFDAQATSMTAVALKMYGLGMVSVGLVEIIGKIFYSIQDTTTPMKNGALSMLINIILNLIVIKPLGLLGLALSTSISSTICVALLFYSLSKKIGYFGQNEILKTGLKALVSAILMGIITSFTYGILNGIFTTGLFGEIVSVGISVLIGAISYGIFIIVLKVEEVNVITGMLNKKLKK